MVRQFLNCLILDSSFTHLSVLSFVHLDWKIHLDCSTHFKQRVSMLHIAPLIHLWGETNTNANLPRKPLNQKLLTLCNTVISTLMNAFMVSHNEKAVSPIHLKKKKKKNNYPTRNKVTKIFIRVKGCILARLIINWRVPGNGHSHDTLTWLEKKQLFHINNQKKYKKQKDANIIHKENIDVCEGMVMWGKKWKEILKRLRNHPGINHNSSI